MTARGRCRLLPPSPRARPVTAFESPQAEKPGGGCCRLLPPSHLRVRLLRRVQGECVSGSLARTAAAVSGRVSDPSPSQPSAGLLGVPGPQAHPSTVKGAWPRHPRVPFSHFFPNPGRLLRKTRTVRGLLAPGEPESRRRRQSSRRLGLHLKRRQRSQGPARTRDAIIRVAGCRGTAAACARRFSAAWH